jgi:putative DNA primase/helicase
MFDANVFLTATPEDWMFAVGGIAFESPADAVRAYPDLWPTAEAAKKAMQRSKAGGHSPIRALIIGECPPAFFTYQRQGNGQRRARCVVDLSVVNDPKIEIERMLGPLAFCMPVEQP